MDSDYEKRLSSIRLLVACKLLSCCSSTPLEVASTAGPFIGKMFLIVIDAYSGD